MQIRVKCKCGEGKCPEWAIVELQGVVKAQLAFQGRLQNLEIGILCRPYSEQVYTFTVGYHELTGSKLALKKPLLLLQKIKHSSEARELQGVVKAQPAFQDRLQNLEIGILCRPYFEQVYTFTVGYHELTFA